MKNLFASIFSVAVLASACGGTTGGSDAGTQDGGTTDAGPALVIFTGNAVQKYAITPTGAPGTLSDATQITAYLDGKTMTMTGANIPSHPNGIYGRLNAGAATQCYQSAVITATGGASGLTLTTNAQLGAIKGTDGGVAAAGTVGVCDISSPTPFGPSSTTAVLVSNVKPNGECFDIDVTYPSYGQEGRASIANNVLSLELFFKGAALNNRCADGNPGSATIKVKSNLP